MLHKISTHRHHAINVLVPGEHWPAGSRSTTPRPRPRSPRGVKKVSFWIGKADGVDSHSLWIPPGNKAQKAGEPCSWQQTRVKMKSILSCQLAPLVQFNRFIIVEFAAVDMPVMVQNPFCFSPNSVSQNWQGRILRRKRKRRILFRHCSPKWILSYCDCEWGPVREVPRGFLLRSMKRVFCSIPWSLTGTFFKQSFFSLELFKISNIKHSLQRILVEGIESLLS